MGHGRRILGRKLSRQQEIGEILRDEGYVTADQLEVAMQEQQSEGTTLVDALLSLGFATEWDVAKCLVMEFQLPFIEISTYEIAREVKDLLPPPFLHQHLLVPLDVFGKTLAMATTGGITSDELDEIEEVSGMEVALYVALASDIRRALQEHFPLNRVGEELSARFDQLFDPSA